MEDRARPGAAVALANQLHLPVNGSKSGQLDARLIDDGQYSLCKRWTEQQSTARTSLSESDPENISSGQICVGHCPVADEAESAVVAGISGRGHTNRARIRRS